MSRKLMSRVTCVFLLMCPPLFAQSPVGTAIGYQGRLEQNGLPMNGNVDFQFRLYDEAVAGTQIGPLVQHGSISLDGGIFHVLLDFGTGAFPGGEARWLEVDVRHPPGMGDFDTLSPRHELSSVPYAIGLSLPYRGILESDGLAGGVFEIINNGVGWAGVFRNNNPANSEAALNVTSMSGLAGGFLNDAGGTAVRATTPQGGVAVEAQTGPGGYAGHFTGPVNSRNYFERFVGIGIDEPQAPLHVNATAGIGVLADNAGLVGVNGRSSFPTGIGVLGNASSTDPQLTCQGVVGRSEGPVGVGVRGLAVALNGVNRAVWGETNSPDGYAAYFTGPERSRNYFQRNVGIGTVNPNHELVIQGDDPVVQIRDDTTDNSASAARLELLERAAGTYNGGAFLWWNGQTNKLLIGTKVGGDDTDVLVIDRATRSVGIATQTPGNFRLAVNGSIRAKEIVVETGWSDFVFEPGYELRSLEEVEAYVQEHGHLPDIPSAGEIEENGVKVGEMHSRLLQKLEEMTLHMIDMNKRMIDMNKRMQALEQENQELRDQRHDLAADERSVD